MRPRWRNLKSTRGRPSTTRTFSFFVTICVGLVMESVSFSSATPPPGPFCLTVTVTVISCFLASASCLVGTKVRVSPVVARLHGYIVLGGHDPIAELHDDVHLPIGNLFHGIADGDRDDVVDEHRLRHARVAQPESWPNDELPTP